MDDCPIHTCLDCDLVFYAIWNNDGIGVPEMHCIRCGSDEIETEQPKEPTP